MPARGSAHAVVTHAVAQQRSMTCAGHKVCGARNCQPPATGASAHHPVQGGEAENGCKWVPGLPPTASSACAQVFLTSQHLSIAMEYAAGGDMFEYVVRKGGLRESEARWFFQQLIVAVDYIHRMVRTADRAGSP